MAEEDICSLAPATNTFDAPCSKHTKDRGASCTHQLVWPHGDTVQWRWLAVACIQVTGGHGQCQMKKTNTMASTHCRFCLCITSGNSCCCPWPWEKGPAMV